jgi:hypothetical protein
MKGGVMTEAPGQPSPEVEAVKHEIRDEHGDAADAPSATPQQDEHVSPEELEKDPAHNPESEALKNVKGA